MPNCRTLIMLALVFAAALCGGAGARADTAAGIYWQPSPSVAAAQASASHTLLMVDVYTDWCGWCKRMDLEVYPNAKVVQAVSQYAAVRVNAEHGGAQLAAQYGVTGYPTILLVAPDGTLVRKLVGYQAADGFAATLNDVTGQMLGMPQLKAILAANPADAAAGLQLIQDDFRLAKVSDALAVADGLLAAKQTAGLPAVYSAVGRSLLASGDTAGGAAAFQKAVTASTAQADLIAARIALAQFYLSIKDDANARTALQAVISTKDMSADAVKSAKAALKSLPPDPAASIDAAQSAPAGMPAAASSAAATPTPAH